MAQNCVSWSASTPTVCFLPQVPLNQSINVRCAVCLCLMFARLYTGAFSEQLAKAAPGFVELRLRGAHRTTKVVGDIPVRVAEALVHLKDLAITSGQPAKCSVELRSR